MIELFELLSTIIFQTSYVDCGGNYPPPLDKVTEKIMIERRISGDRDARDILVKHNMRLVMHVVKKYNNYSDIDELVSVGSIGLVKAIDSYSLDKATGLATYAARCIENEILMTLRSNKKRRNDRSLYEPLSFDKEGNEISLIELLSVDEDSVTKEVENLDVANKLMEVLRTVLDKRELEILILRYGLCDTAVYTQIEVSIKFNISRSYVSRIEKKALRKARDYMVMHNLR